MRSKRCGRASHTIRQGATCAGLIGLLVALSGCASERNGATSSASTTTPMHLAGVRVEIEADGLPAQLAPRNPTPGVDDPREPWSPNYGSVRPNRANAAASPVDVAMPPPARAIPVSYTQPIDAEDIIRRAVATHEMRQED